MIRFAGLAGIDEAGRRMQRPVVTIGVFDGFHRGHRHVVERLLALAHEAGGSAGVITFETHPRAFLKRENLRWLTSTEQRQRHFERAGIAFTVLLPFDDEIRAIGGETFVEEILVARLGVAGVVLGFDARFGRDRSGDRALLERLAAKHRFRTAFPNDVTFEGEHISSTAIRHAVGEGDLATAERMLGRPYSLLGRVVRGDGRGRGIGFPTANLDVGDVLRPPRGVYAGSAEVDGVAWRAMTNVGVRPTFGGETATVETHLIGFDGDLYGRELEPTFERRLRDERRFDSVEELRAQLARDRDATLGTDRSPAE